MFGYIIVNKPEMKFKEYDIYHAYYCGLCRSLKKKYGMTPKEYREKYQKSNKVQ